MPSRPRTPNPRRRSWNSKWPPSNPRYCLATARFAWAGKAVLAPASRISYAFTTNCHRETRQLPVYALVVSAKGPKLKDSTGTGTPPLIDSQSPPPRPGPRMGGMKIGPDGCPEAAALAAGHRDSFVIVKGPFPGPSGDAANRVAPEGEQPPSIFDALQQQLGRKLVAGKGPVDLLVIDHIEKTPTEN